MIACGNMFWSVFKYIALTGGALVLFFKKIQYKDGKLTIEVEDIDGLAVKGFSAIRMILYISIFASLFIPKKESSLKTVDI